MLDLTMWKPSQYVSNEAIKDIISKDVDLYTDVNGFVEPIGEELDSLAYYLLEVHVPEDLSWNKTDEAEVRARVALEAQAQMPDELYDPSEHIIEYNRTEMAAIRSFSQA